MKSSKRLAAMGFALAASAATVQAVPVSAEASDHPVLGLVKDVNPDSGVASDPDDLTIVGDKVFFTADDGEHGRELWVSDGTTAGTTMVRDINPGLEDASYLRSLTAFDGNLYFSADDGVNDQQLWVSDGTSAGTYLLKDTGQYNETGPRWLTVVGDQLFFVATDDNDERELWVSDGTADGTRVAKDLNSDGASYPTELAAVGDRVFFTATTDSTGYELYVSDGTDAGTRRVVDLSESSTNIENIVEFEGKAYMALSPNTQRSSEDQYLELWVSDGTEAGTMLVKDINASGGSSPGRFEVMGGKLYFRADDGVHGSEVWVTDGTESGTMLVKDIYPGEGSGGPTDLTAVGSTLYFEVDDGVHGEELWSTDGTEAGTSIVKDIRTGLTTGDPDSLTVVGDQVFFISDDEEDGEEIWVTDGTEAGTILVQDLDPAGDGDLDDLLAIGNHLFAVAEDDAHGMELWSLVVPERGFGSEPEPEPEAVCSRELTGEFTQVSGLDGSVARLYMTTFLRQPDPAGHAYWVDLVEDGTLTFTDVANYFMDSEEFVQTYETLDDEGFIDLLYQNVMCRPSDELGAAYWLNEMDTGTLDRGGVGIQFSESLEAKHKTISS